MLQTLVSILKDASESNGSGTIYCHGFRITDIELVEEIIENELIENILSDIKIGDIVNLEFSLVRLNSVGYYEDCQSFVFKNKYYKPEASYYIREIKCYDTDPNEFIEGYNAVLNLINSIKAIAKHSYLEVDVENAILFREDKSAFLSLMYSAADVKQLSKVGCEKLRSIAEVFFDPDTEKKFLYLNELINLIHSNNSDNHFQYLLTHIEDFYNKCYNSYLFYLRNFSYNKLKFELDSKALEYTQKIQTVINDAQTKLIAIPTAFVLVFSAFDFSALTSTKNFVAIGGLFIFSVLLQLFLNNQKSTLAFIKENIDSYRESFTENDIEKISERFARVDSELEKQLNRLWVVQVVLWLMPFSLLFLLLVLIGFMIPAIGAVLLFLIVLAKFSED